MNKLFNSKKAFELSINMLVVIILGVVILGVGLGSFYKVYHKVGGLNDQVDAQTQARLNALLDDGSPIVILMNTREANRGDDVTFSIAVNNNLQSTKNFTVYVSYASTTANYEPEDPFKPSIEVGGSSCTGYGPEACGNAWILGAKRDFTLKNNEREHFPIRITVPKKNILRGQYIFNVDVCMSLTPGTGSECVSNPEGVTNRFSSRQKIYLTIN